MEPSTEGRQAVAVVTGGARGIGRAISLRLSAEGYRTWVADIDISAGDVAAEIVERGGWARPLALDVADADSVRAAFAAVAAEDPGLDVLVNNAAITQVYQFDQIPAEAWHRIYQVNVVGMYSCIQAALPALRAAPAPARIINMASGAGKISGAYTAPYHASKAAVISLTRSAAAALAPDILVNSVCPGVVETPMWDMIDASLEEIDAPPAARYEYRSSALPLGRPGTPDEVAAVVAFLASRDACYVTGEDINVTGGSVMH